MRHHLIAAALVLLSLPAGATGSPDEGTLAFAVDRNNSQIGTHTLTFSRQGDKTDVRVKTDIAVKVAFITAYRFEHTGHETWQDGKLALLESRTNDDGTRHELKATRDADALNVHADGKSFTLPALFTGSLWNRDLVGAPALINTLDGSEMKVQTSVVGTESVEAAGRAVEATHVRVSGDLQRDVWYDSAGRLVRLTLKGKDGSEVLYRLVKCDFC